MINILKTLTLWSLFLLHSSPEGSKISLSQQRKELGIGQFIPKLGKFFLTGQMDCVFTVSIHNSDHLQEPCGRMRFSLVQHRRLLLKIRTVEERSPTVSGNGEHNMWNILYL